MKEKNVKMTDFLKEIDKKEVKPTPPKINYEEERKKKDQEELRMRKEFKILGEEIQSHFADVDKKDFKFLLTRDNVRCEIRGTWFYITHVGQDAFHFQYMWNHNKNLDKGYMKYKVIEDSPMWVYKSKDYSTGEFAAMLLTQLQDYIKMLKAKKLI